MSAGMKGGVGADICPVQRGYGYGLVGLLVLRKGVARPRRPRGEEERDGGEKREGGKGVWEGKTFYW